MKSKICESNCAIITAPPVMVAIKSSAPCSCPRVNADVLADMFNHIMFA